MKRVARRLALSIGLLGLPLIGAQPVTAQTAPQQNATVTITDSGMAPATVTIAAGGSITWVSQSFKVHTATSLAGTQLSFDTGGLGPAQSSTVPFAAPGVYPYTSS